MGITLIPTPDALPKRKTAYLSRASVAMQLHVAESVVVDWIAEGLLPAVLVEHPRRYYVDPEDLPRVLGHLPAIPPVFVRREAEAQRRAADAEAEAARTIAEIGRRLAQKRSDARWTLLDELTLQELLDYLREFRTDDRAEQAVKIETQKGLQQAIDRPLAPAALGSRPKGVPERAKARRLSTAIGQIDIWYWWTDGRGWFATYGGPRPRRPGGRGSGTDTAYAAIKYAGLMARYEYGKPVRRSSVRQRFRILARDGFACHYCGRKPPAVEIDIDHVVPVASGGSNDDDNLVAACSDCNHGKADIEFSSSGSD